MLNNSNTATLSPIDRAYLRAKPAIIERVKQAAKDTQKIEGTFKIQLVDKMFTVEWDNLHKLIWIYRTQNSARIIRY